MNTIDRGPKGVNRRKCAFCSPYMPSKQAVGKAFRLVRKAAGLSQDDFTYMSSRTFVSSIERGLKSPTIEKLSQLCELMGTEVAVVVMIATSIDELDGKRAPTLPLTGLNEMVQSLLSKLESS
jgi:transcriptional regulator with XRE-family HTH domain